MNRKQRRRLKREQPKQAKKNKGNNSKYQIQRLESINNFSSDSEIVITRQIELLDEALRIFLDLRNVNLLNQILVQNINLIDINFSESLKVFSHRFFDVFIPDVDDQAIISISMAIGEISRLIRRLEIGDISNNIEVAITGYKIVLENINRRKYPLIWANHHNLLAFAYTRRIEGDREDNFEKAIYHYQQALLERNRKDTPQEWASTLNDLGLAYQHYTNLTDLGLARQYFKGDKKQNIEKSIDCFNQALLERTRNKFPLLWAKTQYNLGVSYACRLEGNKEDNIEKAIYHYEQSLLERTQQIVPFDWAKTINNLGGAYKQRIKGDRIENQEKAIECFKKALQVRTREQAPEDWAISITNLAICYTEYLKRTVKDSDKAIDYLNQVLSVFKRDTYPEKWAGVQAILADIFCQRIKGDKIENLEQAIKYYQNSLSETPRDKFPLESSRLQNRLAKTYQILAQLNKEQYRNGNSEIENIKLAINYYENALLDLNSEELIYDFSYVIVNLINLYISYPKLSNKQKLGLLLEELESVSQKIKLTDEPLAYQSIYYTLALIYAQNQDIEKASIFLEQTIIACQKLNNPYISIYLKNIGDIAYNSKQWDIAIKSYEESIKNLSKLRSLLNSDHNRQQFLKQFIDIYSRMIHACINHNKLDKALETIELARSQYLRDLFTSNDILNIDNNISKELQSILDEYEYLQTKINQLYNSQSSNFYEDRNLFKNQFSLQDDQTRASIQADNYWIAQLEQQKKEVWKKIRKLDPVLAGEIEIKFPDIKNIQKLLHNKCGILNFHINQNNIYAFLLTQENIYYHQCSENWENFQDWFTDNYLLAYLENQKQWIKNLPNLFSSFADKLKIKELVENYLEGIKELIIIPHIYLHLIPFSAIPINEKETLGDRFLIRYAPSCQILEFCANRPELGENLTYGTVENATEDLPCASFEGEQIAQLYQIPEHLRLQGSEQATVKNYRQLMEQVQVLHSSHHAQSRLDNPLESSLKLADGYITLGQLLSPGWRMPNLSDVFLSCCETGLGVTEITDDILTLATGFLCAGARSVISTLWSVDDIATSIFSIIYHQNRKQGLNRPQSLQQAQIQLRTMTGEILAQTYKPLLEPMLSEKLKYSESNRKEVKKQQSQFSNESVERKNLDTEYEKWNKLSRQISKTRKRLQWLCQQEYPFENPVYWAAFVCHGLS